MRIIQNCSTFRAGAFRPRFTHTRRAASVMRCLPTRARALALTTKFPRFHSRAKTRRLSTYVGSKCKKKYPICNESEWKIDIILHSAILFAIFLRMFCCCAGILQYVSFVINARLVCLRCIFNILLRCRFVGFRCIGRSE